MSDQQRNKKDVRDPSKANQQARKRPSAQVPRQQAVPPQAGRDASNRTDTEPGPSDRVRRKTPLPPPTGKTRSAGLSRQALGSSSPRLARSRAGKTGSGKGR